MNKSSLKKYIIITAVILLSLYIILTIVSFLNNKSVGLLSPRAENNQVMVNSPSASQTANIPGEIKYDASTDLKKELQTVNPEVLDSDFAL